MKKNKKEKTPIRLDVSYLTIPVADGFVRPENGKTIKYEDSSVSEVLSQHWLQRLNGKDRFKFMDEMYRILVPNGKMTVIVPYWTSALSIQDPTHEWPPIVEQSFLYFNKQWREMSGAKDYPVKCDFELAGYGYQYDPETQARTEEMKPFWVKHYNNSANILQVVLTKK